MIGYPRFRSWLWRTAFFTLLMLVGWASLVPVSVEPVFSWQDKLVHAGVYCLFYLVGWLAYPGRPWRWQLHIGLLAYGVGIELLQHRTGYRTMDGMDVVANISGQIAGNLLLIALVNSRGKRDDD